MTNASPPSPVRDVDALWRALNRLPSRSAQLLVFRYVEGRTEAETCALYGVSAEALAVHLVRSLTLFDEAMRTAVDPTPVLPKSGVHDAASEQLLAEALGVAAASASNRPFVGASTSVKSNTSAELNAEAARLLQLAQALRENGAALKAIAERQAQAEESSPSRRRSDLLRGAALVALVAAAFWLYLRQR